MQPTRSFTGHSRRRVSRFSVRLGEFLSRWLITVGGIGTIAAVIAVGVFLVWVAAPLFRPITVTLGKPVPVAAPGTRLLRFGADEYQLLGWSIYADGTLQVVRLDTGKELDRRKLFEGDAKLTACSPPGDTADIAFGFDDGTVRVGRVRFQTTYPKEEEVDDKVRALAPGETAEYRGGLVLRQSDRELRLQAIEVEGGDAVKLDNTAAVELIDLSMGGDEEDSAGFLSYLAADGKLHTHAVKRGVSLATGNPVLKVEASGELALPARDGHGKPAHLLAAGIGDSVFVAWDDGHCARVQARNVEEPKVAEEFHFTNGGAKLTALAFLIGKATLLAGDDTGRVRAWFAVNKADAATGDRQVMVAAHDLGSLGSPVTSIATSGRSRMAAAGAESGHFRLVYVTSENDLADLAAPDGAPVRALLIAPKDNAVLVRTTDSIVTAAIDTSHFHPEITPASLFLPVWYEGYDRPRHVWQTTGGDSYEPKYGFWPLVFGTLKATFYSLLMGVPLALLAAVYTSEFLHPRAKAVVKPTVEMMASLPSVVLGFLSALVLAPFVESWLAAVLAAVVTVPGAFVLGGYVWQLLPEKVGLRLARYRFVFVAAVLPLGLAAAALVGPVLERLLFAGDLKAWLDGKGAAGGDPTPGTFVLLAPVAALVTFVLLVQFVNPLLRPTVMRLGRLENGLIELVKFAAAAVFVVAAAYASALLLTAAGFDPRGSVVGTYVQRNALIVGFMMGFAIIPIIFTIAEDALSAVPEHLRSASLGCGATPWQTATRVIIPTAMSGLFSAVMVGLGRAVGETMIVLMGTGNTPLMDFNIFNGFKTLSANIATEMPDAVVGSTHYRTLFLCALVLFAMTFVLNTVAEVIRQRFRRRAFQL
jgi:phosphate transport system permease protein